MAFKVSASIRFHQCDPAGILFYGESFRLAHDAYEDFLYSKPSLHELIFKNKNLAFPIRSSTADFTSPLKQGPATVEVSTAHIGDSSFTLEFKIFQNDKLGVSVKTTHVTIEKASGKKQPLPSEIKEQIDI